MNGSPSMLLLWVPWVGHSENAIRSQHWTKTHRHNLEGKEAWRIAFRSCPAVTEFWMGTTQGAEGTKPLEMPLPQLSELTTVPNASSLNTPNSTPAEKKAQ